MLNYMKLSILKVKNQSNIGNFKWFNLIFCLLERQTFEWVAVERIWGFYSWKYLIRDYTIICPRWFRHWVPLKQRVDNVICQDQFICLSPEEELWSFEMLTETESWMWAFKEKKSINIFFLHCYGAIPPDQNFSTLVLMIFGVGYSFVVGAVCAL